MSSASSSEKTVAGYARTLAAVCRGAIEQRAVPEILYSESDLLRLLGRARG